MNKLIVPDGRLAGCVPEIKGLGVPSRVGGIVVALEVWVGPSVGGVPVIVVGVPPGVTVPARRVDVNVRKMGLTVSVAVGFVAVCEGVKTIGVSLGTEVKVGWD